MPFVTKTSDGSQVRLKGKRRSGEKERDKKTERKEKKELFFLPRLFFPQSVFSHEDRPVRVRVWNWAVTLSVCWSESESLSHLSPGNHSSLSALSGHHTNHSQHYGINWSPGLSGSSGTDREREGQKDGHQPRSSDGGHADQIEFQALQSWYGLKVALNILEPKPPPQ